MMQVYHISGVLAFAFFVPAGVALPAPQMSIAPNLGNSGPVGGVNPTEAAPVATATSGSLYGSSDLLGEVASPVQSGDSAIVSNYELVNGQESPANLGLYLDFNSVQNPQPIRGTGGQTDPGPSELNFS